MTKTDINSHIDTYEDIWESIVKVIKDLDYDNSGTVDLLDIEQIHQALEEALQDFKRWEEQAKKAVTSLGGKFGEYENMNQTTLSIDLGDLQEHVSDATARYSNRLHTAFARISGSDDLHITKEELDENKESVTSNVQVFVDLK